MPAPSQRVGLAVGGSSFEGPVLGTDWQTVEFETPAEAWRGTVNRVTLQFTWAVRPADVGLGGDTRALAAQVDYLRIQVRDVR